MGWDEGEEDIGVRLTTGILDRLENIPMLMGRRSLRHMNRHG